MTLYAAINEDLSVKIRALISGIVKTGEEPGLRILSIIGSKLIALGINGINLNINVWQRQNFFKYW